LARLGVEVRGGVAVTAISAEAVTLATGEQIAAATVLWAAGVAASPLTATLGVPLDRAGRIPVEPDLRIPGHAAAYAIGDLAAIRQDGQPVPGVAPAALQAGRAAAANILRQARGEPPRPFRYVNRGNLAVIGRAAGVADFGWLRLDGLPAWLAWLLVHLWFLIGFANRLLVLFQWGWSYFTGERTARLITGDPTLPRRRATAARPESAPPAAAVRPADQPAHGGERDDRSDAH
jgi:NADH dehydrogenase